MKIIEAAAFWFSFAYKAIDLFIERYIIILCNSPKYMAHALYNKQTIVLLKWVEMGAEGNSYDLRANWRSDDQKFE